jgi:1-acyl-sn-glycerol-3-phosphate acyltransferase
MTTAEATVEAAVEPPELQVQQGDAAKARWQFKVFRLVVRAIFLLLFRVRVIGRENLPPGNAIICINHLGWTEGFMTLLFLPIEPRIYGLGERGVAYIAPWRTRLITWLQVFVPLDRESPRQALNIMEDVIRRGGSLALAVEGHLGYEEGTISPLQPGAAYLSQRTGVPLVPIGFTGNLELWLWCTLKMRIGKALYPEEFSGDKRSRTHAMTARLESDLRALLPGDVDRPRIKLLSKWLTKLF